MKASSIEDLLLLVGHSGEINTIKGAFLFGSTWGPRGQSSIEIIEKPIGEANNRGAPINLDKAIEFLHSKSPKAPSGPLEKIKIWLPHQMGLYSAVADKFRDQGYDVRFISEARETPQGGKPSRSPLETVCPGEQSKGCRGLSDPDLSETQDPKPTATDQFGKSEGGPSQRKTLTIPEETKCEVQLDISCQVNLTIQNLTVNF